MTTQSTMQTVVDRVRRKAAGGFRRLERRLQPPAPPEVSDEPRHVQTTAPPEPVRYRAVPEVAEPDRYVPPWPAPIAAGRLGQLDDAFQDEQQRIREPVQLSDCEWYHEVELREGDRLAGAWDLIGNEDAYLGGVDVAGTRVLEMGPATGYLTFFMEQAGANVVGFDAGFDTGIDLVGGGDIEGDAVKIMRYLGQVQNSWWWLKRHHDARSKAVYGSIYDLPADLGRFDITLFASILLHLRDPYLALQQAARVTDAQIVVTDVVPPGLQNWKAHQVVFHPVDGNRNSWWQLSPALIQRMLETLGFRDQTVTRHEQYTRPWHDLTQAKVPVAYYTLVARR